MDNLFSYAPGQTIWMPVLSGSMAPAFLPGDEVMIRVIDKPDSEKLALPGTVAVFYDNGRLYFHRILFTSKMLKNVYEKGDSNLTGSWINKNRIMGVVEAGRRKRGSDFMQYESKKTGKHKIIKILIRQVIKKCLFIK